MERVHPDDRNKMQEFIDNTVRDGGEHEWEHRLLMPDGLIKTLHIITHTRTNEAGQAEFLGTAMDVTAFKQVQSRLQASLEEKNALLKEVHHRVKNNLQLINSLLSLQAARIADPAVAELFAESRNRVRSMALVHENLYRAGNFARIPMRAHIQNLAAHLIRAYGLQSRHIELSTEIDDIELDLDRGRFHRPDHQRAGLQRLEACISPQRRGIAARGIPAGGSQASGRRELRPDGEG